MEEYKDNIIETINKAIKEIKGLKDDIAASKSQVDEINSIKKQLNQIEVALSPRQKGFSQKIDSLELTLKELKEIRFDIMLTRTDKMFKVIKRNLLDGMHLQDVNDNLKDIIFNKGRIGSVEVLERDAPEIKIRVTVFENSDEFEILEPSKMFSVISFINTKFNYKEA